MQEVFGRESIALWSRNWHWFYSTFNMLFLMGHYPETTYYKRRRELKISNFQDRAMLFVEKMLPQDEQTPENEECIAGWLRKNAGPDGLVAETSDIWYGFLLWDVREKTDRPALDLQMM